ncbi:MAG: hypothetical protein OQK73_02630 [Gammaproteobacteria bacterium]|nr:hypothetical protein [Gammaproteobacteria bacterium]
MKKQIRRFSPHQNAKVFSVMMAISVLFFTIPMALMFTFVVPPTDQNGNPVDFPVMIFWLMPIFYLIFGYISVAIGCAFYNFLFKFVGGIEIEVQEKGVE